MAKPLWQQKLQAKLDAAPLFFVRPEGAKEDSHITKHEGCLQPGERKGKKVTLRLLVNYSFNTCAQCKKTVG